MDAAAVDRLTKLVAGATSRRPPLADLGATLPLTRSTVADNQVTEHGGLVVASSAAARIRR